MMIHELVHASQVRRLEMEKGTRWVAEYWSINAKKQLNNTIFNGGDPYGKKGDYNWEQTALSEGWGYFMEWTMARDILGWHSVKNKKFKDVYFDISLSEDYGFPIKYGGMYEELSNLGCSYTNMERCLVAYSLEEYKNNLIRYYPHLNSRITQIINKYENIAF